MRKVIAFIFLLFCSSHLNADEIYLNNGDKITGDTLPLCKIQRQVLVPLQLGH